MYSNGGIPVGSQVFVSKYHQFNAEIHLQVDVPLHASITVGIPLLSLLALLCVLLALLCGLLLGALLSLLRLLLLSARPLCCDAAELDGPCDDGAPDSDPADPELGDPCGEVDSGGGTCDSSLGGGGTSDAGLPEARDGSPLADHADDGPPDSDPADPELGGIELAGHADDGPPDDRCGDTLDGARLLDIRITLLDLALDFLENFDELLENPIIEDCDDLPLDNDEALEEDDCFMLLPDDGLDDSLEGDELLLVGRQQHQP